LEQAWVAEELRSTILLEMIFAAFHCCGET